MKTVVRIRTAPEKSIGRTTNPNRHLAHFTAAMILPLALFCFSICVWRWGYELSWTSQFPIREGMFAHWQTWFVGGTLLQIVATRLARYADSKATRAEESDSVLHTKLLGKELF